MKLYYRPASPFARKVRVMAHEVGLFDQIDMSLLASFEEMAEVVGEHNPLGKIPTLILDDGTVLYDSPVICEYLDGLHDGEKLFPADGSARWAALRQQALADGIGEAVVIAAFELNRPEEHQLQAPVDRQLAKIRKSLARLDADIAGLRGPLTIGHIAVGCALGYLYFWYPDFGWETDNPALADWIAAFNERPSMKETFFARPADL